MTTEVTKAKRKSDGPILARRALVAELLVKNVKIADIAKRLGYSIGTIRRDIREIEDEWAERSLADINRKCAEQLAKIDAVESEAWEAWQRSQKPSVEEEIIKIKGEDEVSNGRKKPGQWKQVGEKKIKKKHQNGDPKYLAIIQKCIDQRIKLFRLDEDTDTGGNIFEADIPVVPLVIASRDELAQVMNWAEMKRVVDGEVVSKKDELDDKPE